MHENCTTPTRSRMTSTLETQTNSLLAIDGDHLREDYYAWKWGDALFVVLNPFQYTMTNPYSGGMGGEDDDESVIGDRWDWTLGLQQFNWFKQTLAGSNATFKFVFAHHMVGGSQDYVRGGAGPAHLFEWGGENLNGSWGFATERPEEEGWEESPIHQVMVANGVTAFFHGHDHQFAHEERDGIVYQLVPQPSDSSYGNGFNLYHESDPYAVRVLPNSGHLRVTVSPSQTTVDYVRSYLSGGTNGQVAYSYTIPAAAPDTHDLTMAVDPGGSGTTDPAVGVHPYAEDAVVAITTTPNAGYVFDHWEGDVADPDSASTTVTMDEDQAVTAHFTAAPAGAITYIGDIGTATSKSTGTALTIVTTADVAQGDDIIITFATYGDPDYEISVTDDAGNTYEQAAMAICYQHGRTYIFAAYNVNAMASGSEITISHTSVAVRAAVASVFRGLADVEPLDQSLGYPTDSTVSGTTPSVGPTGMTTQADELLIGAIGTEGPVEDNPGTWDYSFIAGPRAGTTGGTANTNWTVSMGYRIVSTTGEYIAQKSGVTDRRWAAAIATFKGEPSGTTYDLTMAVDPAGSGTTTPAVGNHTYPEDAIAA
jgi:uncharacterized repeat protein (TIGR02543 family)